MNKLLDQARSQILAKVDQRLRPVVDKLVNAGHKVMWSDKTRHLMVSQLAHVTQDQADETIGTAVAKLVGILYNQSQHTAPMEALVPAGMVLLMDGLEFLEEAKAVQVSSQFLAECTKATGSAILQLLGVTPDKLAQLQAQGAAPGAAGPTPAPQPGIVAGAMQQPQGGA